MTDVLRKFNHDRYPSLFQSSASTGLFRLNQNESVEELLTKVCTPNLSNFNISRNTKILLAGGNGFTSKGGQKFYASAETNKKVYFCQRCLNHSHNVPRKNHKSDCPYSNCKCEYCILVERRRKLNSKLNDLDSVKASDGSTDGNDTDLGPYKHTSVQPRHGKERVPNCQKCGQHGKKSRLKGHKRICPFRECKCVKCQVVTERQKLMADQIKIRRRQKKDNLMNITRDHIASQIQAAAALSAASGLQQFPFNALNSALLYQLKTVPNSLLTSPASSDGSSYSPQSSLSSAFSAPTGTPEILKTPVSLVPPSPPSPVQTGIVAPVAINPSTPNTTSAFTFPLSLGSDTLLQTLLANYKLLEPKLEPEALDISNAVIDVCTV